MLLALGAVLGLLGPLAPAGAQTGEGRPTVLVTSVDDPITPVIADHLADVVSTAEDEGYAAVVVEMDTPGGLDTAMRDIVQTFLRAEVPVVVHVTPSGARAASAGVAPAARRVSTWVSSRVRTMMGRFGRKARAYCKVLSAAPVSSWLITNNLASARPMESRMSCSAVSP